jgi:hypothetical protein
MRKCERVGIVVQKVGLMLIRISGWKATPQKGSEGANFGGFFYVAASCCLPPLFLAVSHRTTSKVSAKCRWQRISAFGRAEFVARYSATMLYSGRQQFLRLLNQLESDVDVGRSSNGRNEEVLVLGTFSPGFSVIDDNGVIIGTCATSS